MVEYIKHVEKLCSRLSYRITPVGGARRSEYFLSTPVGGASTEWVNMLFTSVLAVAVVVDKSARVFFYLH